MPFKVFVTGGTGFIGSAIIDQLLEQGHQVTALCRDEIKADKLKEQGATPVVGTLESLDILTENAKASDGVIHLAFPLDLNDYAAGCITEKKAIEAMCDAMAGTGKPFVGASGLLACVQPAGSPAADETFDKFDVPPQFALRLHNEKVVLDYKEKGVRTSVIRLSPTVHDTTRQGLLSLFVPACKGLGYVPCMNGGNNVWPSVHRLDAAALFIKTFEKGTAGSVYHGRAEVLTMKEMCVSIGKKLALEVKDLALADAPPQLGPLPYMFSMNADATAEITIKELGWAPKEAGLLQDIGHSSIA